MTRPTIFLSLFTSISLHAQSVDLFETGMKDWDTYLGPPHYSVDLGSGPTEKGVTRPPVGLNHDPKAVFNFIKLDGKTTLKITGEIFGALTTKTEFENYHFKVRMKWGEAKWAPRASMLRDSGILYHCVGEHGKISNFWMESSECQVQEHDCGDLWLLGTSGKIPLTQKTDAKGKPDKTYQANAPLSYCDQTNGRHIQHGPSKENLKGWNLIEVYTVGTDSIFVVNGTPNMVITDLRHQGNPLSKGKIQIQSEGAEVYYQDAILTQITDFPTELKSLIPSQASKK